MSKDKKVVVFVLARNSEGVPEMLVFNVRCTELEYMDGEHYKTAEQRAKSDDYSVMASFDENDTAGRQIIAAGGFYGDRSAIQEISGPMRWDRANGRYDLDAKCSTGVSIAVKGHALQVVPTDEGVVVDDYLLDVASSTVGTMAVSDCDLEESFVEHNEIDIDAVAEWVGLHYKRNFDAEPAEKRYEWLQRYVEAHAEEASPKP